MRREKPIKRRNPSGEIVWMARYTGRDGKRHIAKPTWNRGKGTFRRKGDAQKAIDEPYGLSDRPDTLGDYAATWTERHPRSERTNASRDRRAPCRDDACEIHSPHRAELQRDPRRGRLTRTRLLSVAIV